MQNLKKPYHEVILPLGNTIPRWEQEFKPSKNYIVDKHHPEASDENSGTEHKPFLTINQAARVLKPGEQVLVKNGVYREWVRPSKGGNSPDSMISYAAFPGHNPVIRASKQIKYEWELAERVYNRNIWRINLPLEFFSEWSPLMSENLTDIQFMGMPYHFKYYYGNFKGKEPYNHKRALLFVEKKRQLQVKNLDELRQKNGCFHVDNEGTTIHLSLETESNPNTKNIEISEYAHCFAPVMPGINYIHVSGFIMEHAGNGFTYPMAGAISPNFGHHWIIEKNTVRNCNGIGIDVGVQLNRMNDFYLPGGGHDIIPSLTVVRRKNPAIPWCTWVAGFIIFTKKCGICLGD